MTDPTPGGWPDASKPGVPQSPERDGWHWLQFGDDRPIATAWVAELNAWASGAAYSPDGVVELGFRYIGPCLLPSEVAAQVEAARREEREANAAGQRGERWAWEVRPKQMDREKTLRRWVQATAKEPAP
jgi:hypothetical protein